MGKKNAQQAADQDLKRLEQRIDELIRAVELLKAENRTLRAQQDQWSSERSQLVERSEVARNRVEAMIGRLKAMEQTA